MADGHLERFKALFLRKQVLIYRKINISTHRCTCREYAAIPFGICITSCTSTKETRNENLYFIVGMVATYNSFNEPYKLK